MNDNASCLTFRVRYAETDQMGVAYYGSYPVWFEIGRTEYCRERGINYSELEKKGTALVVAEMWVKYIRPVYYDDLLTIVTWIDDIDPLRMVFRYEIHNEGLITEAYTKHVFVDIIKKRPSRVSRDIVKQLTSRPEPR